MNMPFALYEYDAAFSRFFSQSMRVLAQAHSPLLAQMTFVEMAGALGSRIRDRQGLDVEIAPGMTSTEVTSDLKAVREGDYEQLYKAMYESADAMAEELVGASGHSRPDGTHDRPGSDARPRVRA